MRKKDGTHKASHAEGRETAGDGRSPSVGEAPEPLEETASRPGLEDAPPDAEPAAPQGDGARDTTPEVAGDLTSDQPAFPGLDDAAGGAQAPPPEQLAGEYLDQLQRMKAEFDNYRRRVVREREDWFESARAEVVRQLLPVLDDLTRAKAHQTVSLETSEAAGLFLILKRLEDVLNQLGLKEQEAGKGTEFDPEVHEAVMSAASGEVPEGCIVQVIEPGYLFQGRMLRPSKVVVSSGPAPE